MKTTYYANKTRLISLFCLLLGGALFLGIHQVAAQSTSANDKIIRLMDQYIQKPMVDRISLAPKRMVTKGEAVDDLVQKIDVLNILSISQPQSEGALDTYLLVNAKLNTILEEDHYKSIVVATSGKDKLSLYEPPTGNHRLLFVMDSSDEYTLICIDGEITPDVIKAVLNGEISLTK